MSEEYEPSIVVETAVRLLRELGPMTVADLSGAVRRRGLEPEDLEDELFDSDGDQLGVLADDRWAHVPSLLQGRVFTHQVSAEEIDHDVLNVNPDLEPILALDSMPEWFRVDGTPLKLLLPGFDSDQLPVPIDPYGALRLPRGTLRATGATAGGLVGLRVGEGGIVVSRLDTADLADVSETVQARLRGIVESTPDWPTQLEPALLTVCADVQGAFVDPQPPVTELLARAGVAHEGDFLGPSGFDFDQYRADRRRRSIAEAYQISDDEADFVLGMVTVHRQITDVVTAAEEYSTTRDDNALENLRSVLSTATAGPTRPAGGTTTGRTLRSMQTLLAEPIVAYALWSEAVGDEEDGAAAFGLLTELMEETADRAVRPALKWLSAKAYDRTGKVVEAEECLKAGERLDPGWPPIVVDLARYASDRGDAARGLSLLQRVAPGGSPLLEELLPQFLPTPGPSMGRNEPCWCGSGRKFKQCHLNRVEQRPLDERAVWLYQKAGMFVSDGPWQPLLVEVARLRAAYAETEAQVRAVAEDPIVGDAVLFEGGGFEEFLRIRGVLLPADERLLGEQWLLVDRSVFEVVSIQRGRGFTARDLRTGDVHEVHDRAASRQLEPAQLICARIVPAGEGMQIFGGVEPVGLHERDALIELLDSEPDPQDLVAFLTRRFAPPALVNTDRHPLVICDAVVATGDLAALIVALDQRMLRLDGIEPPQWHEVREIDGLDRITAMLEVADDRLKVNTNSEERMVAVLGTLRGLAPDLAVESDERRPMRSPREMEELADRLPPAATELDQNSPEVREAVASYMADYEQRWLDLSLPALSGLTPRQAAADPTRRGDLRQLLASFRRDEDDPTTMSPSRIQAALGLD